MKIKTVDLTTERCPLTLVRAVEVLDQMLPGEVLDILVKGAEPVRDMVNNLANEGHSIITVSAAGHDVHHIRVRRGIVVTDR